MDDYVLYHHGIKGMRWGIRRYQNPDGSLTKAGQRRAEKEAKKKEEHEQKKQAAVKTGSASEVLKYKNELTKQEMDAAMNRIRWEQEMSRASKQEVSKGKQKVDKFFAGVKDSKEKADTIIDATNTLFKAYNTFANLWNVLPANRDGSMDFQLPRIDTRITTGNRNELRQIKKEKEKEKGADD